jgi:hypothetical protein
LVTGALRSTGRFVSVRKSEDKEIKNYLWYATARKIMSLCTECSRGKEFLKRYFEHIQTELHT